MKEGKVSLPVYSPMTNESNTKERLFCAKRKNTETLPFLEQLGK